LAIRFEWIGDRFGHCVLVAVEGRQIAIARYAEAVDSDSTRHWPVFQELSVESIGGADVACLVGMSGKTYWSASVENAHLGCGYLFDLSRKGPPIDAFNSEYRLLCPARIEAPGTLGIEIDGRWRIVVEPVAIDGFQSQIGLCEGGIAISSAASTANGVSRLRCKYRWRILRWDEIA
jgi:hypothetical protein